MKFTLASGGRVIKKHLNIYVPERVEAIVRRLALEQESNISAIVSQMLEHCLKEIGELPEEDNND